MVAVDPDQLVVGTLGGDSTEAEEDAEGAARVCARHENERGGVPRRLSYGRTSGGRRQIGSATGRWSVSPCNRRRVLGFELILQVDRERRPILGHPVSH